MSDQWPTRSSFAAARAGARPPPGSGGRQGPAGSRPREGSRHVQGLLRGRHTELSALKAAFDAATTRGRLAVVRGEPGSGKTELLRQAAAMWRKEGISVVSAQPRGRCVVLFDNADEVK